MTISGICKNVFWGIIIGCLLNSCRTDWHRSYDYDEFKINGRECVFVRPKGDPNGYWIVRPAFLGQYPQVDDSLLHHGWSLAFCDVTHEYGNFLAQKDFEDFIEYIIGHYKVNEKFVFEGLSRGGYFSLFYAIRHPEQVECIYVDAPVCDLNSWLRNSKMNLFEDARKKWDECGIDIENVADYPIKHFEEIREIPLIVVYGDCDTIVPFKDNFGRISINIDSRHKIIRKTGAGHHPHSLSNPKPIVEFIRTQVENSD